VLILPDQPPGLRFPTATELQNLQARNVPTPGDTSIVYVDLASRRITFGAGQAVVLCLQFPQGGRLTALGVGPGIACDDSLPDQDCDYFTTNGGAPGGWFIPDPNDPQPLDWGFEMIAEDLTAVESETWSSIKALFRPELAKPYTHPY